MSKTTFNDLNLSLDVLKGIEKMEYSIPTEIQEKTIPLLLEGRDIIGQGQTGTGKTLAYGSVLLTNVDPKSKDVKALILAPTRELALQIHDELKKIGRYTKTHIVSVYGGSDIERQIRDIKKGASIVVGTPGRVQDLLRKKVLKLKNLDYLVLDEADEMLNMGFVEDIENIMEYVNGEKQMILFSATMPLGIKEIAKKYMKEDHQHIQMISKTTITSNISQYYLEVRPHEKLEALCRIVDSRQIDSAIVFCKTKRGVDELCNELNIRHYNAESLHGDLSQNQRFDTLNRFKKGKVRFLVATDVAARGIDVDNISHVINYEMPMEEELYVHRIGRCGRANNKGDAFSIVTQKEKNNLLWIVKKNKSQIEKMTMPKINDIIEYQCENIFKDVETLLPQGDLDDYKAIVENIHPKRKNDVLAALLMMNLKSRVGFDYKTKKDKKAKTNSYKKVVFNCGSVDKINAKELKDFILKEGKLSNRNIGHIELKRKNAIVEIEDKCVDTALRNCYRKKLKQRRIEPSILLDDMID